MTKEESSAISFTRTLSCVLIICCHFLQAYDNPWAWVLNTGVQIFLLISGFLYGIKGIDNITRFYIGRIRKIYIPYLVWTGMAATLIALLATEHFSFRHVAWQILMRGRMPGQEHLWFIPVLFECYILLPFFCKLPHRLCPWALGIFGTLLMAAYGYTGNATYMWMLVYYTGYTAGRYHTSEFLHYILLSVGTIFATTILAGHNVTDVFRSSSPDGRLVHVCTAFMVFELIYLAYTQAGKYFHWIQDITRKRISHKFTSYRPKRHINLGIKGREFEIYLVHQTFILGPLSVIGMTGNTPADVCISLVLIAITTSTFIPVKNKVLTWCGNLGAHPK